jgi:type IV pilus assembly protein PilF
MSHSASDSLHTNTAFPSVLLEILTLVVLIALLSGCASKQENDAYNETNTQKAVESNTALGLEYMNRGQYEVALGKLKKAVREDPNYAPAQTVLAVLYEKIGEQELAGQHYKKAYEAAPKDGDVNNNYGVYLCKTGNDKQAIEHILLALDDPFYSSPAIALSNAGSCALGAGNMDEADEYLRRALRIEPNLPDALRNMARLNYEQQNYLTARAFLQRYESSTSHSAETLLLAYRIETASSNKKAAAKYKLMLEHNFPESDQTAEVRRLSGR